MQHLNELRDLISQAADRAGNEAKLAKALGVPQQQISNWKAGTRSCVPEDQALLASIAGLDPIATLARAMVYKHEGTPRGDRLMRALGKSLQATGAALGSAGASAAAICLLIVSLVMPAPTQAAAASYDVYTDSGTLVFIG